MRKTRTFITLLAAALFWGCNTVSIEFSGSYTEAGVVIAKEHHDKEYLNPVDDINPMKDVDPTFDFKEGRMLTSTPEENLVYLRCGADTLVVDDEILFSSVKIGSKVEVVLVKQYQIKKDKDGMILEKVFLGNKIVSVNPNPVS